MENIHFDEHGQLKLQEMSHVFFNQYKLSSSDMIFLPPEALAYGKTSDKADVWSFGIILLLCISLEFDLEAFICKFWSHLILFFRVQGFASPAHESPLPDSVSVSSPTKRGC